jgi:nitrate reductase assembly molybdenum cofactor insertion protein NarJ
MSELCIEEATLEELLDYLSQQEESAVEEVRERLEDLRKRIALLEAILTDALDNYEYYAQYAGEFLCKKHRVGEDIAEKRALLQEQKNE